MHAKAYRCNAQLLYAHMTSILERRRKSSKDQASLRQIPTLRRQTMMRTCDMTDPPKTYKASNTGNAPALPKHWAENSRRHQSLSTLLQLAVVLNHQNLQATTCSTSDHRERQMTAESADAIQAKATCRKQANTYGKGIVANTASTTSEKDARLNISPANNPQR